MSAVEVAELENCVGGDCEVLRMQIVVVGRVCWCSCVFLGACVNSRMPAWCGDSVLLYLELALWLVVRG
jgi:hypothetical protein